MRHNLKNYLPTIILLAIPMLLSAAVTPATADSISHLLNRASEVCDSSCSYYAGEHSAMGLWNSIFTFVLVVLGAIWLFSTYKKKYILLIGGILGLAVAASYLYPEIIAKNTVPANCPVIMQKDSTNGKAFLPPTDEFQSADTTKATGEFTSAEASTDEFSSADSEFSSAETIVAAPAKTWRDYAKDPNIYEPIVIFLLVGLISLGIKNKTFRKYRGLFLLASVLYLGFYRGACPCMISSWQNNFLILLGVKVKWETLLWFLLLIPGAYLFGKIWCGWLCHLGALQEFLFKALNVKFLQGNKAQKIIKYVQISVFVLWIIQLILTRTNLFCEYDPFKVAFNLISPSTTGWVLLGILMVSSVLVYRPFCRTFCPVGLTLGWVSLIPGARKLDKNDTCINCKKCDTACQQRALIHENKVTTLRVQDCILCGECISECNVKKSLNVQCKK
jgi:NAD-dependent dihydropyrimidine dehydrogenase PreA subunit